MKPLFRVFKVIFWMPAIAMALSACAANPQAPGQVPTGTPPAASTATPDAAEAARQALAELLGIDPDEIQIQSVEAVNWPDACLGLPEQGQACLQVITPGFRFELEVDGQQYLFHTDETGKQVLLASAPLPQAGEPVIRWTQTTAGGCEAATIRMETVAYGPCNQPQAEGPFVTESRVEDLAYFREKYNSFEAETQAGKIEFNGQGQTTPTAAEQRMLAEWAGLVYQEAVAGRSGASWGLAFTWHREGGIAGFCEDIAVYVNGEALASSCQGIQPVDLGRVRLTPGQLEILYGWLDRLRAFEYEYTDPATADAMTIRIVFSGTGETEESEADIQAIQELAQDLLNQASATPEPR